MIIIDEAQAILNKINFEEFRLMLNFQLNESFLLSLILIGQPELIKMIKDLPQLDQRFAIKFHLKSLSADELRDYVRHRITVAGGDPQIFGDDCFKDLYDYSNGIPRKVNNICDLALLEGSSENAKVIDRTIINKIISDFNGDVFQERRIE